MVIGRLAGYLGIAFVGAWLLNTLVRPAEALGSEYKNKRLGSFDHTTIFSFHIAKQITTIEGGCITTKDEKLAKKIASKSNLTIKIGKRAFYKQLEMPLKKAYKYTSKIMTENMMALDANEGISAYLEKRNPRWQNK